MGRRCFGKSIGACGWGNVWRGVFATSNQLLAKHRLRELLAQRVYAIALGYEDQNDHGQLRHDPLLRVLVGKRAAGEQPLAGKSTLNRLELSDGNSDRYKKIHYRRKAIDALLVDVFIEAHAKAPAEIVIGLDTTDLALHGH